MGLFPGLNEVVGTMQLLINLQGAINIAHESIGYFAKNGISNIKSAVNSCLVIYVVFYGWAMLSGTLKDTLHSSSIRVFKVVLVITLAMDFGEYNSQIVDYFWTLPEKLAELFVPENFLTSILPASTSKVDLALMLVTTVMSATVGIMQSSLQGVDAAGGGSMTSFAIGLGTGVAGAGLAAVTASILLVAKFTLAALLAVGPLFIVSILFEKTKHFFEAWLAQLLNIAVTLLLLSLTIYILFPVLLIAVSSYYLIAKYTGLTLTDSVELMTLLGIYIGIIKQVPTTSAALVRGYAIGGAGDWSLSASPKSNSSQSSNRQAEYNNMQRR